MPKRKRKKEKRIVSKVLREATPLLLLTVFGSAFAGSILGKMEGVLILVPGVFVLIPAILDLRGDVGLSFGSRLSSLLHLGLMKPSFELTSLLTNNILGSFSLSFSFSAFFGILAHLFCLVLHLPTVGITKLTLIGLMSGMLSSLVLIPFTLFLAIFSFKKGLDPDNIISPAIAVVGDGIAMVSVFLATMIIRKITIPDYSYLIIFLFAAKESFPSRYRFFRIFAESSPVIVICGILGISAGLFLHYHQAEFSAAPYLLVLLPQLISKGGSIGSIAGMRLTSGLYIGYTKPFSWNKYVWQNLLAAFYLSLILVLPVAAITHITALLLHIGSPIFSVILILTFIGMVPLSLGVSLLSFLIASISKRIHLDPSNVVVPLITSIGDVGGVFLFLSLLHLFGR
jgi:mgtE-like transporter